jgi:hypothetical protein
VQRLIADSATVSLVDNRLLQTADQPPSSALLERWLLAPRRGLDEFPAPPLGVPRGFRLYRVDPGVGAVL